MNTSAQEIINTFGLHKHIEGGWYVRTFQSEHSADYPFISHNKEKRFVTTSIYYVMLPGEFSAFHKIKQYETWHFYCGSPIRLYWFDIDGLLQSTVLGNDYSKGHLPQFTFPPDCYFAAEPIENTLFSFAGCTVCPGFDYADFHLASSVELIEKFPKYKDIIKRLTR